MITEEGQSDNKNDWKHGDKKRRSRKRRKEEGEKE